MEGGESGARDGAKTPACETGEAEKRYAGMARVRLDVPAHHTGCARTSNASCCKCGGGGATPTRPYMMCSLSQSSISSFSCFTRASAFALSAMVFKLGCASTIAEAQPNQLV